MTRQRILMIFTLLLACGSAQADWSANVGFASEYYYRGMFQHSSSASGGVDFETGGFYAGVWAADIGEDADGSNGLEVDGYFGYGLDIGDISIGIGFTGYFYTNDFDDTYQEINLSAGFGMATLDVAIGEYDNFTGPTQDYTYYALTLERGGFYGKYAGFSEDFDGNYLEFGYGATVSDIDLGVYLLISDEDLVGNSDEAIVFTIGKTFDFN